jgi:hypothetical protein
MRGPTTKPVEAECPACNGTGFPEVSNLGSSLSKSIHRRARNRWQGTDIRGCQLAAKGRRPKKGKSFNLVA